MISRWEGDNAREEVEEAEEVVVMKEREKRSLSRVRDEVEGGGMSDEEARRWGREGRKRQQAYEIFM